MAPKRNEITVAVIGLIGVLGTALIANWKGFWDGRTHPVTYKAHVVTFDPGTHKRVPLSNFSVTVISPAGLSGTYTRSDGLFELFAESEKDSLSFEFTVSYLGCNTRTLKGILTKEGEHVELCFNRCSDCPPDSGPPDSGRPTPPPLTPTQQAQLKQLEAATLLQSIRVSFRIVSGGHDEYLDYGYGLTHSGLPRQFVWEIRPGAHGKFKGYWISQANNLSRTWRCFQKDGPLEVVTSPPQDEELFLFEIVKLKEGVVRAQNVFGKYIRWDTEKLKFQCDTDRANSAKLIVRFD